MRYAKEIPTYNFLNANFKNRDLTDTVYVTAHPMYTSHNLGSEFHAVVDVWVDGWDDDLYTVPPKAMATATRRALEEYPEKQVISHFMQPHYPFLGEYALRELSKQMGFKPMYEQEHGRAPETYVEAKKTVWQRLEDGEVSCETVEKAYRENLEIALPYVGAIVDEAVGKTVITSDHGNLSGSRPWTYPFRVYGHPAIHTPELLKVPWLVPEYDGRRPISSGEAAEADEHDWEMIQDRLAGLGYAEM